MPNPFYYGGMIKDPAKFFGRRAELGKIFSRLGTSPMQCISVVGERRIGKSSLLYHLTQVYKGKLSEADSYTFLYLDPESARCHTQKGLLTTMLKGLLEQIELDRRRNEDKILDGLSRTLAGGREADLLAFEKAVDYLHSPEGVHIRPVVCLDEFEKLIERPNEFDDDFYDSLRGLAQSGQIAFVAASKTPLEVLSRQGSLTSPFFNIFAKVRLGELTEDEARELIRQPSDIRFNADEVALALKLAGRHPWRLQIACSIIYDEKTTRGRVDKQAVKQAYEAEVKSLPPWQKGYLTAKRHGRELVGVAKYVVDKFVEWKKG